MRDRAYLIKQAKWIIYKLERISADSVWAHRSSGQRGAILKLLEQIESDSTTLENYNSEHRSVLMRLENLVESSYQLLEKAAREYYKPSRK